MQDQYPHVVCGPFEESFILAHEFGASLLTAKLVEEAIHDVNAAHDAHQDMVSEFGIDNVTPQVALQALSTIQQAELFLNMTASAMEAVKGISA